MASYLRFWVKRILFPGLDLHTRCRYRYLSDWIRSGQLETLDAGFGNGALMYSAYRKGNIVLGVSFSQRDILVTSAFFDFLRVPRSRAEFRLLNIYDLRSLNRRFDQIICSETLEHLSRDAEVLQMFADLLQPHGRLILCTPYALHPHHSLGRVAAPENGGHVRHGYTLETIVPLIERVGLRVVETMGLGSRWLTALDTPVRTVRHKVGDVAAIPLFLAMLPLTLLDRTNSAVPFSIALVAEKALPPHADV
jgi:SAM-dependent methyltransferase